MGLQAELQPEHNFTPRTDGPAAQARRNLTSISGMKMRQIDAGQQLNPLLPGYSFNIYLVAGTTPIIENGPLDFVIDRQNGMSGFIINMTIK